MSHGFRARVEALGLRETQEFHAEGSVDGVPVVFVIATTMRVSASFRPVLDLGLAVADGVISGDEPARAASIWGAEGAAFLADLPNDMYIVVSDRELEVVLDISSSVRGGGVVNDMQDVARILVRDSMVRMMVGYARELVSVVGAMQARTATSPVAAPLRVFEPALTQFAKDHGLEIGHTPFRVGGEVAGLKIFIAADRVDKGEYQFRARLHPANKALKGITLARKRDVGPEWVEAEGNDVDFGDAKLNEGYLARSVQPKGATLLASPLVGAWLGQMLDRDLAPSIRNGRAELAGVKPDPQRPEQLANLGEDMLTLGSALSTTPTSAYR